MRVYLYIGKGFPLHPTFRCSWWSRQVWWGPCRSCAGWRCRRRRGAGGPPPPRRTRAPGCWRTRRGRAEGSWSTASAVELQMKVSEDYTKITQSRRRTYYYRVPQNYRLKVHGSEGHKNGANQILSCACFSLLLDIWFKGITIDFSFKIEWVRAIWKLFSK